MSMDNSSAHSLFVRSASLNRGSNTSSFRRVPSGLSRGGSGSRQDSLGRRRSSTSLSRDAGDQILERIRFSQELTDELLGDVDSSAIAQVGDRGDRVVGDDRENENVSRRFSLDEAKEVEKGVKILPDDAILTLPEKDATQKKDWQYKLPKVWDYISYLLHLAVFGILGVLTRYLLQKLFGPNRLSLTGDNTPLYLDLPSNMLGSFLMGWFGIVFKADIRHVSDHMVVGLTTGYMGSLTTFSGWNQKMLDLSSKGHWVFAVAGIILGMFIVNESIRIGVESAEWLREILFERLEGSLEIWRVNTLKRHVVAIIFMLMMLGSLWGLSVALATTKLDNATNGAVLWLGCVLGPPGVWTRWYLARLNGQGLGRVGLLKWLPIGTLSANVLAACLMAGLSTLSKAVNTKRCTIIVSGVQFGYLGCLSTVSTFVAEFYTLRQSGHSGRALAYAAATIIPSFAVGTLIYSVPVWVKNYT